MTFTLGLYDLFAHSIPGFLYLSLFGYVATRAEWISIDTRDLKDIPALLVVVAVAVFSYLLGHVTTPLGKYTDRLILRPRRQEDARSKFLGRDRAAVGRRYLDHSVFLLQARAELVNRDVAAEVSRLRATGLMLRNCAVPLLLAFLCAVVELIAGDQRLFAAALVLIFASAAWSASWQSQILREWAHMKTLELCFWDDGADHPPS